MSTIHVRTDAFDPGATIPAKYTCDGEDVSPPLSWDSGPEATASYALIMDDPDAPGGTWVHWVAWNIPNPNLPEAVPSDAELPDGTRQGENSWPKTGYGGPCPPSGEHRYFFKLYALDTKLELTASADEEALVRAMEGHLLAQGELMGVYSRR